MHEAISLLLTVLFWSSASVARRLHKTSVSLATMLYSFGKIHASPAKKKKWSYTMYSYILNISVFPGTKVICDTEFYHFFYSDILCVCVCVCVVLYSFKDWNILMYWNFLPIPVAARSKTCVCGLSLAGNVGSNPAGDMDFSCVVFSHVEVSASGWSLVQRIPTECGVSVIVKSCYWKDPGPLGGCCAMIKNTFVDKSDCYLNGGW